MELRNSGKKRQLARNSPSTSYRLHFSCDHVGRYLASTKRRIRWNFGFTNLHAAGEGKCGIECRGEEHDVELVWSLQSEKVRLFWNKTNISHFFREKPLAGKVDVSWQSRSGETFRILAHESAPRNARQYDLFVDGTSIFSLPHVSQLTSTIISIDKSSGCEEMSEASMDSVSMSECILDDNDETRQSPDADFRLSLAGFPPCNPLDEVVDDLTSAYPSRNNTLESLRRTTTSLIQDSEDIVSRSIINALSEDNENRSFLEPALTNSWESSSTSIGSNVQIPMQIEANVLSEAFEWSNLNVNCAPRIDIEEQKRLFLQKQMDAIFVHAHQERLSEEVASRIVLDIATLLDIPINPSIQRERDTLIIRDLKKEIDLDTLTATLMVFDELREVGVASNRSFAFCRFASERGPLRAFSAADQGTLIINGKPPQLSVIQKPLTSGRPGLLVRRAMSSTDFHSDRLMPKPIFGRQRSHQRNTISIDTLIVESPPFRRLINDAVKVAPLDIASFQKKDYFGKMSSMHTSESVPSLSNSTRIYGTTSSC